MDSTEIESSALTGEEEQYEAPQVETKEMISRQCG